MSIQKIILIVVGCIAFTLGTVGTVLPILPTVPLYLLAAFCFGKSSDKLNNWFKSTKLYKDNLESYVAGKGMTSATKARIMITVTALMAFGFIMMKNVPIGRIVLAIVWAVHVIYFVFGVKTLKAETASAE